MINRILSPKYNIYFIDTLKTIKTSGIFKFQNVLQINFSFAWILGAKSADRGKDEL